MTFRALRLSASALTLAWSVPALAQTAPQPPATLAPEPTAQSESTTPEVVVTAERRTTNLQTTPIAATVLSGADLQKRGVFTVDQLQFVSPSLTVNNFGQGNNVDIRGIGKGEHNSTTATGVVTYRDGAATFPGYMQEEPYFDIASVEVLRGPQGTFSGQNATGGAIIVNTQDPKINGGYTGYLLGKLGNYNDVGLQGAINLPISNTLAARIAFNGEHRSSFYTVSGPSGSPDLNWGSARVSLLWTPSPQIKLLWKTDYDYLENGAYFGSAILDPSTGKPNGTSGLFKFANNYANFATDKFVRSTLKADYVDSGSGVTFRSVSSYQQGRSAYTGDLDGTALTAPAIDEYIAEAVDERIFSEEVNIISPDNRGPLSWILGGYYQNNRYVFPPGDFTIGIRNLGVSELLDGENPNNTEAVFGQIGYKLSSRLQIQAGLRYSHWDTTNRTREYAPELLAAGYDYYENETYSGNNITGKVTLNWTLDEKNFLYAFVASGSKPGGLNYPLLFAGGAIPAPFRQEYVTDYELGWKTRLLDNHVRLQLGAFYNDFKHFQVTVPIPDLPSQTTEMNVPGSTRLYGVEASAQARLGDFTGTASLDLQKSKLGRFYSEDSRLPTAGTCDPDIGPTSATCVNLAGHSQTYAPDFTFNASVQYDFHIGGRDLLTPNVSFAHISDQWGTLYANATQGDRLGVRNVWNISLAWTHGSFVTTLYCYNLTDDRYVTALLPPIQLAGAPRQFGLSVLKMF
jgi:iron complex outermembrane receptor protein